MIRDDFGGVVPEDVSDLRRLPGVGEYTANAVGSFAFGRRVAVVDTNVGRVLARAVANRTLNVAEAREVASELLPRTDVAAFNQAMLDLGAQYCTSSPRCDVLSGGARRARGTSRVDPIPRREVRASRAPNRRSKDRIARPGDAYSRRCATGHARCRQLLAGHGERRTESWRDAHRRTGGRRSRGTPRTTRQSQWRRARVIRSGSMNHR